MRRLLLLSGLAEVAVAAQEHCVLSRHVSPGIPMRYGSQLFNRRPRRTGSLRGDRAKRGVGLARVVWGRRRFLFHRRREGTEPAGDRHGGLFLRWLGIP